MKGSSQAWWVDDLRDVCALFQMDLSCLVDRELDEVAAVRAMAHMEECEACAGFFEDVRAQVRAHRQLVGPDELIDKLVGAPGLEAIDLRHRLAQIFYQLGKAYVLTALDPGFVTRVFEPPVDVGSTQANGRGFVDGVLQGGRGRGLGIDWEQARHMLNGRLKRIESPLEKGRRLLQEALAVDPEHEESRLYVAYLHEREGKPLRAAHEYRQVFRSSIQEQNRGHAAIRLGVLHAAEGEHRKAIACYRWVLKAGLAEADDRFFVARFNIAKNYARLGDQERSLDAFRELLDRHPERLADVVQAFLNSPRLQGAIDSIPGFGDALVQRCPELFAAPDDSAGAEEIGR